MDVTHQYRPVLVRHSSYLYPVHCHRPDIDIHSRRRVQDSPRLVTDPRLDITEGNGAPFRRLPSPVNYDVDAAVAETHHVVPVQLRLDAEIKQTAVCLGGSPSEHVHPLSEKIPYVVDFLICPV